MAKNLIKQTKTPNGKLNCYAVDTMDDLLELSEEEAEIIGCRAYCIFNGKFYVMNSNKDWVEAVPVFNDVLKDIVRRRGMYSWKFDPTIHDGIQEIEVEFIPTLEEFEKIITRTGDYTFRYNKIDYDGFDDFTVHFIPTLQEVEEEITRNGDYEYEFNPEDYDGISKVTVHVTSTLKDINEEITRAGDYNYTYDPEEFDGIGEVNISVKPTLQTIEKDIEEGGKIIIDYDPEEFDGIEKVILNVLATGNGDKVAVDEEDKHPGYLVDKLVSAEGSGIELKVIEEPGVTEEDGVNKKLEIKFSMNDFEIEFLETMPFASMQESINPLYSSQSATLIASSVIPNYSFSFRPNESKFICYSDTGDMTNCRLVALKLNSNNSATVIAYSKQFRASTIRDGAKIEAACEWSNGEKIKAGERYYLGIVGRLVDTSWLKIFGYQSWASQSTTMNPPFNIYSNYNILASPDNQNIPANQIFENSANTIYIGVTH